MSTALKYPNSTFTIPLPPMSTHLRPFVITNTSRQHIIHHQPFSPLSLSFSTKRHRQANTALASVYPQSLSVISSSLSPKLYLPPRSPPVKISMSLSATPTTALTRATVKRRLTPDSDDHEPDYRDLYDTLGLTRPSTISTRPSIVSTVGTGDTGGTNLIRATGATLGAVGRAVVAVVVWPFRKRRGREGEGSINGEGSGDAPLFHRTNDKFGTITAMLYVYVSRHGEVHVYVATIPIQNSLAYNKLLGGSLNRKRSSGEQARL
ncbi:hypothetical protein P154DRAFT_535892 [Amniculicola lignicola CBS 123094]|uniref:Uncharacterized protein n=1 Tax=Amniculicola lignicola CBS 123094 TaxID=1392246 RepID=A0A6A5WBH4_9PLEO|nr:hypothetical protein P154DRAFT_535892 [Amniculicola lignicola CBS 123094]